MNSKKGVIAIAVVLLIGLGFFFWRATAPNSVASASNATSIKSSMTTIRNDPRLPADAKAKQLQDWVKIAEADSSVSAKEKEEIRQLAK